jgi:hypothetical protein
MRSKGAQSPHLRPAGAPRPAPIGRAAHSVYAMVTELQLASKSASESCWH